MIWIINELKEVIIGLEIECIFWLIWDLVVIDLVLVLKVGKGIGLELFEDVDLNLIV